MSLTPEQMAELQTVVGRVNALHTFCMIIARSLPPEIATVAASNLSNAYQRVEADALASPVAEPQLQELLRVTAELHRVLESAIQGQ